MTALEISISPARSLAELAHGAARKQQDSCSCVQTPLTWHASSCTAMGALDATVGEVTKSSVIYCGGAVTSGGLVGSLRFDPLTFPLALAELETRASGLPPLIS